MAMRVFPFFQEQAVGSSGLSEAGIMYFVERKPALLQRSSRVSLLYCCLAREGSNFVSSRLCSGNTMRKGQHPWTLY